MSRWWTSFKELALENGTYKLVALFVTLSLWVFILERHEVSMTRVIQLEYVVPGGLNLAANTPREVKLRARGPRMALKRFLDSNQVMNVDLSNVGPGKTMVQIFDDMLQPPSGIKILWVNPSNIAVELLKKEP